MSPPAPPADPGLGFGASILLGLVQGLAEFLPVSSSGHLVLAERLLGVRAAGVTVEVALHIGTLAAVVLYYARDLAAIARAAPAAVAALVRGRLPRDAPAATLLHLAAGTVPAALVVLVAGDAIEEHFHSVRLVLGGLVVTGLALWTTRRARAGRPDVTVRTALLVGAAQAVAILPGVSRSGSTIAAGAALGLSRESAARFSFLLSIPAVVGAIVHEAPDLLAGGAAGANTAGAVAGGSIGAPLLAGVAASCVSGLLAIRLLLGAARRNRLDLFSWYLWTLAAVGFLLLE